MGAPVIWGSLLGVGLGILILAVFIFFVPLLADASTALDEYRLNKKIPRDSYWRFDFGIVRVLYRDGEQIWIRIFPHASGQLLFSQKYFLRHAERVSEEDFPLLLLAELP